VELQDEVMIVTGASEGIGRATARALARRRPKSRRDDQNRGKWSEGRRHVYHLRVHGDEAMQIYI